MRLPAFCRSLEYGWPNGDGLVSAIFVSSAFDTSMLCEQDFNPHTIPCPENLRNASIKRRAEFLAGRMCAQQALFCLTGTPHTLRQGNDRLPRWPRGCVGSISHSNALAAAVVAYRTDYRSLGIDLEHAIRDEDCTDELIGSIQTPAEWERLAVLPTLTRGQALTLAFSIKESVFKALYPLVHTYFDFKDVELIWCKASGTAGLQLQRQLDAEWREGSELEGFFCLHCDYLLTWVAIAG